MISDALASESNLARFLDLPARVYEHDPYYIAEPIAKTRGSLLRERFAGRQAAWTWAAGEETLARVVARVSPVLKDSQQRPLGMLGFFEAEDRPEEVAALLHHAIEWLKSHGVSTIVGPMDGDTWHRYRFNVGPFEEPPFLMEPYNPPYYARLWEATRFRPLENYYSKAADAAAAAEPLAKIHQRVLDHGYRLRPIVMDRFRHEMEIIYRLSVAIFDHNFLYEAISLDEFLQLYEPARALIDPDFVRIAETPSSEPVGFVFSIVDYHEAVAAMRGRSGLFAKLKFLRHKRAAKAVNIKSLGVLPDYRHIGLAAALMCQSYRTALEKGLRRANLCLIRDGNPSGRLDGDAGTISRRYVLYHFTGEAA